MFRLTPKGDKFFDYFDRLADLAVAAAERFLRFLEEFSDPPKQAEEVKALEREADEVVHEVMALLHKSFITPFERDDIRLLIDALDDVLDFISAAANRIALYEIGEIVPDARSLSKVLVESATGVREAVRGMRNLRKRNGILEQCIEVNRLENKGDRVYQAAIAQLFKSRMDPLLVIQWKEIFEGIEDSLDRCEDVAELLEGIVLENA
ncbi:MAG: DUF47 domain-containing protein [Planctomycetota bacterium]|jgi:uncharacterized protein Yka (UPF0111/DUF47 family)